MLRWHKQAALATFWIKLGDKGTNERKKQDEPMQANLSTHAGRAYSWVRKEGRKERRRREDLSVNI